MNVNEFGCSSASTERIWSRMSSHHPAPGQGLMCSQGKSVSGVSVAPSLQDIRWLWRSLTAAALLWALTLLAGCSSGVQRDAELVQAERTARYITSPRHLKQSMYVSMREENTPSELLSYLFSSLGAAEWPYTTDASEMEQEQARAIGMPLQPANVAIVVMAVDSRAQKQIVLRPDDANGLIIAEAYLAPDQPPVFTSNWAMPQLRERE